MTLSNAHDQLAELIEVAGNELRLLGEEPLAIASATHKFNDATEDDYWCAVQLGQYQWEQSQFFGSTTGHGIAKESSTLKVDPENYGSSQFDPENIQRARGILRRLDKAGWRQLATKFAGLKGFGDIIALAIQFDQIWLHCSDSYGGDDYIFALIDGTLEQLANSTDCFTNHIGFAELIQCASPDLDIVVRLSPTARSHFDLSVHDKAASHELADTLLQLADLIDDTIEPVDEFSPPFACPVGFTQYKDLRYPWVRSYGRYFYNTLEFAVGETRFDRQYFNTLKKTFVRPDDVMKRRKLTEAKQFEELYDHLEKVDRTRIRQLFEKSTGKDTFDSDQLYYLVLEAEPYLLFRNILYHLHEKGMTIINDWRGTNDPIGPGTKQWLDDLGRIFSPSRRNAST
ncbi:MAG: hypothetical protein AAGH53_05625 [Pseudomonadota bacterium]